MTPFEVIAFGLLGLILLVGALGGGTLLWMAGQERRTIEALASTPCPVCRQPLGKAAVNEGRLRAHEASNTSEDDDLAKTPEHMQATWTIVCPQCQSELQFDVTRRAWLHVKHPHQHPYRAE